jgi:hypothetical protein
MGKASIHPKHPERICWGCEKYCPTNRLNCRETRVEHPVELFGEDWLEASNRSTKKQKTVVKRG